MMLVVWTHTAEIKMLQFKSDYFTQQETRDFIAELMPNIDIILLNPF